MSRSDLITQSTLYAAGNIANKVAGFLMLPLYTFYLSRSDYGVIEYVDLFVMVFGICLGLQALGCAQIRIYHEQESSKYEVVSTTILLALALSFPIVFLGVFFSSELSMLLFDGDQYAMVIACSFPTIMFTTIIELLLTYKRLEQKAVYFIVFSLVRLVFTVILNVYLIAYLQLGALGFALSALVSSLVFSFVLVFEFICRHGVSLRYCIIRKLTIFGAPLIFASVSFFTIHFSDRFLLNHFYDLEQVGLYSLAYKFAFLVTFLIGEPFGRVWNVNVFEYAKSDGWENRFAKIFLYLTLCLFSVAALISVYVDCLFGWIIDPKFTPFLVYVPFLVFAYALREQGDFFRQLLYINKRSREVGRVAAFCAVANLLLSLVFIPPFGALGASLATMLTWFVYNFLLFRLQHFEFSIRYPIRRCLLVIVLSVCLVATSFSYRCFGFWQNIALDTLLVSVYVAIVWRSQIIDPKDRAIVKAFMFNNLAGAFRKASLKPRTFRL